MATITKGQTVANGLGTWSITLTAAGMHTAQMSCNMTPPSGIIMTIAQTGSASSSVSSVAPTPAQNHIELRQQFNCAIGDIITFTIASSSAIDKSLNEVRTIIGLHVGTV
jgi:hypothetical protein